MEERVRMKFHEQEEFRGKGYYRIHLSRYRSEIFVEYTLDIEYLPLLETLETQTQPLLLAWNEGSKPKQYD